MRDHETISAALTAAETGHLVIATLHANDAMQAIDRIIDVFPPFQQAQARTQLAASLIAVVNQRLFPRKDEAGRIAAFEIMVGTSAIKNLIRNDKMHQGTSLMEAGARDGMVTMDKALTNLVKDGSVEANVVRGLLTNPLKIPTQ